MWNPGWLEAAEGPAILSIASVSLAPGRDAESVPGWQERCRELGLPHPAFSCLPSGWRRAWKT